MYILLKIRHVWVKQLFDGMPTLSTHPAIISFEQTSFYQKKVESLASSILFFSSLHYVLLFVQIFATFLCVGGIRKWLAYQCLHVQQQDGTVSVYVCQDCRWSVPKV